MIDNNEYLYGFNSTNPFVNITNITSIQSYLDVIEKVYNNYDCGFKNSFLWFRGIADLEKYSLLPTVLRGGVLDNNEDAYINEPEIFNAFKKESKAFINNLSDTDTLSWLCYAQHFNVPTRLLDFTSNPLVALYFACKDLKSKDGAVWLFNSKLYNSLVLELIKKHEGRFSAEFDTVINNLLDMVRGKELSLSTPIYPIAFEPYYIDARMSAQSSKFLLWGRTPVCLERFLNDEDYIDDKYSNKQAFIKRMRIPSNKKTEIINQLDMLGINEKALFPGLDGIGKYLNTHFKVINNKRKKNDIV